MEIKFTAIEERYKPTKDNLSAGWDLKARLNTCGSVCLLPGIPVTILDGERIAQIVFNKLPEIEMTEVTADEFSEFTSERGAGGFGHSGRM